MKVVTKNYYQTIKEISYSPAECVKKVFPIHKFGEKEKFLGIPLYTYKDDVYSSNDLLVYIDNFPIKRRHFVFDDLIPKKGYSLEKFDKFISICRMAYINIDGKVTYFANNENPEDVAKTLQMLYEDFKNNSIKKNNIPIEYLEQTIANTYYNI